MTKYGKKILEIVSSSGSHMTAEEIFDALRQTYPSVVLATVYNNLNRLWQEDLLRKVSVEGMPDRYDRIQRHDHLVCKRCGRLLDIDLGDLTSQLEQKAGISILYKIGENFSDFFSTHPSTDKRIAAMYEYIKQTYPQYITQSFDTDAYTYAIEEMLFAYNNK